jgi:nucleotide-binding universal stress UspA family protein
LVSEVFRVLDIRHILFPADFSACCQAAFRYAQALARDYEARLLVLHAATPPAFLSYGELEKALHRPADYQGQLTEQLQRLYAVASPLVAEYLVVVGDPATEILKAARGSSCDLIVMGTEGRTGLGRLVMGSVAEQIVRSAACPVMTVKIPPGSSPEAATVEAQSKKTRGAD